MNYSDKTLNKNEVVLEFMKIGSMSQFPTLKKTLQLTFSWPLQKIYMQLIGRSVIILCLFVASISSGMKLWIVLKNTDKFTCIVLENMYQFITFALIFASYIIFIVNVDKIVVCMSIMTKMYQNNGTVGKKKLMKVIKIAIVIHGIQMVLLTPIFANNSIVPTATIIFKLWILPEDKQFSKDLPLKFAYFFDEDEYFFHSLAFQLFVVSICYLICFLFSYIQCITIGFIIGEIQCLQYYLRKMDLEYEYIMSVRDCSVSNFLHGKLREIARQYQCCISLYEAYRYTASFINIIAVITCSFTLVLTGTGFVILLDQDISEAFKMFMSFAGNLLLIIFICTPSQLLSNASNDLFVECYFIKWYNYSPKARLLLLSIMTRSMKEFVIMAGSFIFLNMKNGSLIIRRSISFITAFRSIFLSLK